MRIRHGTGLPPVAEFEPNGRAPKYLYQPVAEDLKLSGPQMKIRHEGGRDEPAFHILTRTARKDLVEKGYLHRLPRNHWRLTEYGINAEKIAAETLATIGL
jgi:hypothetical protein